MGSFRYRKKVKIAPGLSLNINKKSVSLTGGVRGAHVTRSFGGRSNYSVGIPGTGLWYRGNLGSGRRRHGAQQSSPGYRLATASEGTGAAKVGNLFVWLGGLVWLLPLAAIVAAIAGGIHNFGASYLVLAVVWTFWRGQRARARRSAHQALAVPAAPPASAFTPAELELRSYWSSLLGDGLYTAEDEAALNAKVRELALDVDESGLDEINGRFGDLLWRSKIAMAAAGRLPAVEHPSLIAKPGEVVHLELGANLMRRYTHDGVTLFDPDDNGTLSITSQRIAFIGESRSLDVSYRRLNGVSFWGDAEPLGETELNSCLVIHDTQKTSCLMVGLGNADLAAAVIRAAASRSR